MHCISVSFISILHLLVFCLSCLIFNIFLSNTLCSMFQFRSSTSPSLNSLICHSCVFEFSLPFSCPLAHLQFFISRSNAFSFPDICVFLDRYSFFYSPSFFSSIRLFIRFHRLIIRNRTVARESILSLCHLSICLAAKSLSSKRIENRYCVSIY